MGDLWRPNFGAQPANFQGSRGVPARGGGDWGKKARQTEQMRMKDAKIQREISYFGECQERNLQRDWQIGGPPRKGHRFLEEEARELFGSNHQLEGIDFKKYNEITVQRQGRQAEHIPIVESFEHCFELFDLAQWLNKNVQLMRYVTPTPVQKNAMPAGLVGRDVMCCAQTGSGKTAAFLLPLTAAMSQQAACGNQTETYQGPAKPMALIMAPTRELVSQIYLESRKFCHRSPFKTVQVYGGVESKPQLKELARGVDLIAATPGRLTDFVQRETIVLSNIDYLVLDEADRMLDMGFEPQIRQIVERSGMPDKEHRQTMFFSATFPKEIQILAQDFLYDYIWIAVGRVGAAAASVEQQLKLVSNSRDKITYLLDELRTSPCDLPGRSAITDFEDRPDTHLTLVFVAMKRTASWLVRELNKNRIAAVAIHGDLTQVERERNLSEFKSGSSSILVATDVAARGLDIPLVFKVINYDLPGQIDDYIHRIGRTGRVGHRGVAISFFIKGAGVEGNNGIASDLLDRIEDAGQEVPVWLEDIVGQGGGRKQKFRGGKMGGRDIRNGVFGAGGGRKGKKGKGDGQWGNSWSKNSFNPSNRSPSFAAGKKFEGRPGGKNALDGKRSKMDRGDNLTADMEQWMDQRRLAA